MFKAQRRSSQNIYRDQCIHFVRSEPAFLEKYSESQVPDLHISRDFFVGGHGI